MSNYSQRQTRVTKMLDRIGESVTLPSGGTITVFPVERMSKIRETASQQEMDKARGRMVLFYMTSADFALIPGGWLMPFDGENFTLSPGRDARYGGVSLMTAVLGAAGGYT